MKVKKVSVNEEERVIQIFSVKPKDQKSKGERQTRQTRGGKSVTRGKDEDSNPEVISSEQIDLKDIKISGRHGA